jgi:hypothetical protein
LKSATFQWRKLTRGSVRISREIVKEEGMLLEKDMVGRGKNAHGRPCGVRKGKGREVVRL